MLVVHERVVVRRVGRNGVVHRVGRIAGIDAGMAHRGLGAYRRAADNTGRRKAALEPAPADPLLVQQIADIVIVESAIGLKSCLIGAAAIIVNRVGIADDRGLSEQHVALQVTRGIVERFEGADGVRLPRDQVDGTRRRGTEGGAERIVVERETLGVVPQRGYRVAVVIIERQIVGARQQEVELVHQPAIDRLLLVGIVMVVATRDEVAFDPVEPLRIGGVWVVGQQSGGEPVDGRGAVGGDERGFALRVCRVWIGGEIVIEGVVF